MNILVLGNAEDAHAAHIQQSLTQAGVSADYVDTTLFPSQLQMFWRPDTQMGGLILPGERRLNFTDIKSVFWRQLSGVYIPELKDSEQKRIAINDSMSTLRSLMQACPCRWVNSWQAYEYHKEKPLQLRAVKQIGVEIPATLIGNDPQEITEFAQSLEKVIFKPVYGGAHTQLVTEAHLDPKRLNLALKISPVTLQEYIPGTNIRTYVIADAVYSAEIRSPALDFREDMEAELIPIQIPESVQQQCLAITQALKLEWTAIDWRLKPTGEYIFLEANPSPMFLHFEKQTGYPITDKLLSLLMN
ncbi:RimK-like ATP-grasp domain protein [Calothrix sp. NIES-2100]|uniref:MvdC/MvdD family ATP grasp protein n=1 Tax=Calothrix sp. NIES-2100 TaxID=1954172 RepID=UPI000B6017C1|nr:RimK-like ATP-grasp domain protein [Calothrix sp. NIES-2100]